MLAVLQDVGPRPVRCDIRPTGHAFYSILCPIFLKADPQYDTILFPKQASIRYLLNVRYRPR